MGGFGAGGGRSVVFGGATRRRLLGVVTVVAVLAADAAVLPPAPAAAAEPRPARELPALVSDRAPRLQPAVPEGDFGDPPGRGRSQRQGQGGPSSFDKDRSKLVERSEKSDVFLNPDGSRTARVYPQPVNFKDSSGAWRAIDTKVVAEGGGLRNGGGPVEVRFAGRADDARLVRVASGGTAATFSMPAQHRWHRRLRVRLCAIGEWRLVLMWSITWGPRR